MTTKQILTEGSLARQIVANSFPVIVDEETMRDVVIIVPPGSVSIFEVIEDFKALALAAVSTPNLVAFGRQHPLAQGNLSIVCPGGKELNKRTCEVVLPMLHPIQGGVARISYEPVKAETLYTECGFIATMMD